MRVTHFSRSDVKQNKHESTRSAEEGKKPSAKRDKMRFGHRHFGALSKSEIFDQIENLFFSPIVFGRCLRVTNVNVKLS